MCSLLILFFFVCLTDTYSYIFSSKQEATALAAAEVAFMLQAGQHRGLHVTIAPGPAQLAEPSATPAHPTTHVATPTAQATSPPPEMV